MAKTVRSRRVTIAAGTLSLALAAPFITPTQITPVAAAVDVSAFETRYDTTNIWDSQEAQVEGLTLEPGDSIAPTANTIFNWNFSTDNGVLTVIRPSSTAAFRSGDVDIPVKVTPAEGDEYRATLRLNIVDEQPPVTYEIPPVETRETLDFEGGRSVVVDAWDVPEGVTVDKQVGFQSIGVVGWDVEAQNGKIVVKAPGTFTSGDDVDIPVTFTDGTSTADRTLRIRALNPQTTGEDIAGTLGTIVGNVIGGATGTAGGSRGGLLEGIVKVEVQPSAVVVTDNANNNGSNNSVVVTNNANPTVDIRDNGSNNGSDNNVVITNNANPSDNFNGNGSNNSVVVTDNANPSNNGSNNSVVVTNNANPSNNGSNNSAVVTNNANPSVVVTGNASNNEVQVTGNANGGLVGSSGGSSKKDQNAAADPALVNANVNTDGGSSDPRCIAPLVGLGLPLIALVPLALAQQVKVPGLQDLFRQASRAFDDAVRNTGFDAAQVTAAGGGVLGVVAALLLTAAVRTCIPQVRGVDVNINGSSNKSVTTKAAPVVDTPTK